MVNHTELGVELALLVLLVGASLLLRGKKPLDIIRSRLRGLRSQLTRSPSGTESPSTEASSRTCSTFGKDSSSTPPHLCAST
jgi:hypothetical protein